MTKLTGKLCFLQKRTVALIFVGVAVVVLLCLEVFRPVFSDDPTTQGVISMTVTRGIGAAVFLVVLMTLGYNVVRPRFSSVRKALLLCLPAMLVAVNNAPLIGLFTGKVTVTGTGEQLAWFLAACTAIGLFEELAFRGVVLLLIAEKRRATRKDLLVSILLSSAVFGALHLVNVLVGSDPGAVFLQIGYSFLIGAMCAVVLFKTANIWLCVLLHAVYDVGGTMVGEIAIGRMWDTPTVILTTVLALATVAFYVTVFVRMKPSELDRIYQKN